MVENASTTPATGANQTFTGTAGVDSLSGGGGNDTITGAAGNDVLAGDGPLKGQWQYGVYNRDFTSANGQAPTITSGTLVGQGYVDDFGVTNLANISRGTTGDPNDYGVVLTSTLTVTSGGTYRLTTTSDDGSRIVIRDSAGNVLNFANQTGGTLPYMNNDFHQSATTRYGDVTLAAGQTYTIEVYFWENLGADTLSATISGPDTGNTAVNLATTSMLGVPPTVTGQVDGNDSISGGAGNDTIFGNGGADTIDGGTEADSIDGGDGNDSLFGGTGTFGDTILGGIGNDTVDGGDGNDQLFGGAGTDSIIGGLGDDTIDAGSENDTVFGGDGNDSISGGAGVDSLSGGIGDDTIDGGTEADSIDGGDGNDSLLGGTGTFNDTIFGGIGNDTIDGGDGNDSLFGGADNDSVDAGLGNDTVVGGTGNDTIDGGSGNDSLDGGGNSDTVYGGIGDDTIDGGDLTDQLFGGDGNDVIEAGADELAVGDNDTVYGGAGNDLITDSNNNTDSHDLLSGDDGNDTILAAGGNDTLYGGIGTDSLSGGAGNDQLFGGDGNDTLDGGAGADTLTGGLGSDRFTGIGIGDVVDGSEDTPSNEQDILDLFGSGWTKANTNIIFGGGNNESGTVQFLNNLGQVIGTMSFSNIETIVPCFTPGTLIDTLKGPVAVEHIRPGDRVLTRDSGYQTVRWTGRRDLTAADLAAAPQLCPVRIGAGALGPDLPARDLLVSPQHRMLLTGARAELVAGEAEVLAAAAHLTGWPGISRAGADRPVSYLHLMFDRHEIIRADGAWSESFQPGAASLTGIEAPQLEELLTLFPDLATDQGQSSYRAARLSLKPHEARAMRAA